jgi:hypothetical protein
MTRTARIVCAMHIVAALFLAYATIQQALYGAAWAVPALAACSLVPMVALVREVANADTVTSARALVEDAISTVDRARPSELPRRTPGAELTVAAALASACCEVWWATAGAQHDPATCTRKDSTA